MYILSDPAKDIRSPKQVPGGYEWWYFDAVSTDGQYSLVVIFYEGNPFSTRYITALEKQQANPVMPADYPAVSISVYENGQTIYYSFTEFDPTDCRFSETRPRLKVGPHEMTLRAKNGELQYMLSLDEQLPGGDGLQAKLTFKSNRQANLFENEETSGGGHQWNLVQPRAAVKGEIRLSEEGNHRQTIAFSGNGYHDHNTGREPLREEFDDWYWGRFHFESTTLIYYLMNGKEHRQQRAWLIGRKGEGSPMAFNDIRLSDKSRSIFGLRSAHRLQLGSEAASVRVQQSRVVDNGPFYQRFLSEAFLHLPQQDKLESQVGITEYIRPDRIYSRIFWPLVRMRIRRAGSRPHWVQRSKRLYRWTW